MNNHDPYEVTYLAIEDIKPSPENEELYGSVDHDEDLGALITSIEKLGLEEPLIVEVDGYILSGHRRFVALIEIGSAKVPCRVKHDVRRANMTREDYMQLLSDYNPQRIKTVDAILRETILHADEATLEDMQGDRPQLIESTFRPSEEPEFMIVDGVKEIDPIGSRRQEFLAAVIKIVERMRDFWPLSIRQIHYQLLNEPPMKVTSERSKFSAAEQEERNRYANNLESYRATSGLCTSARYLKHIPFHAVDDPTRTSMSNAGSSGVKDFVEREVEWFLTGYELDKQRSQPVHIECFCEKNTLLGIVEPACKQHNVPLTSGRGFAGPSIWRKMAARYRASGKLSMVVLAISDYDPEGFELVDDCFRSLRDLWGIESLDLHRVAVTEEQIDDDELGLAEDFNPAKESSSRYKKFVERTGSTKTWECEALPPEYLRDELESAIRANMNLQIFERAVEQEERDVESLLRTVSAATSANRGDLQKVEHVQLLHRSLAKRAASREKP